MIRFTTWFMMLQITSAGYCGQEYDFTNGCNHTYGTEIETLNTVSSLMQCLLFCNRNDECLSVKHDVVNELCQLNSERYRSLNTNCETLLDYAKVTKRSCHKLINENCNESDECSITNSQCVLNKCRCDPGYSFKYVNESCVPLCDEYGSEFTAYRGYTIENHNNREFINITSEACMRECTEETSFVCRSFDFWNHSQTCRLSVETAFTKPGKFISRMNVCDVYGSEFTAYHGHITYYNTRVFENFTIEGCMLKCIEETTFVCRSFDFWIASQTCQLTAETAFTQPDKYLSGNGAYYYHRNCQ